MGSALAVVVAVGVAVGVVVGVGVAVGVGVGVGVGVAVVVAVVVGVAVGVAVAVGVFQMTKSESARDEAKRIVREKGGLCLVPKEDSQYGMTCHEWTFCDCHVETIIEKAIEKAEKRGVIRGLRMAIQDVNFFASPVESLAAEADRLEKELNGNKI